MNAFEQFLQTYPDYARTRSLDQLRDAEYARRPRLDRPEPIVIVTNAGLSTTTLLEVRAHDEPGLLHRVARAVASAGATIVGAKVSTLGADVVDVFFVTDSSGDRLVGERVETLRATVLSSLQ